MRFWDASAIVPLLVDEGGTELAMSWLGDDPDVVLWGLTRLELVSAIERRTRDGVLRPSERMAALKRADRFTANAHEVLDLPAVRARAATLLARHALRAADAAQLGAALLMADPDPASLTIAVLDRQLAGAAAREGLRVLTWQD